MEAALSRIYSPFGGSNVGAAWRDDPFGLFGAWVQSRAQETPVRPRNGRLYVSDGRREYVVLPMLLTVSAFSTAGQQALIPVLEQAQETATRELFRKPKYCRRVWCYAAAESTRARRDMSIIGIGSLIGIILLMWLAFRSVKPIGCVLLSLCIGCLGALSICWLLFGKLHLLTLVLGPR